MAIASLDLKLSKVDLSGIDDVLQIDLIPQSNSAGGLHMQTPEFNANGATACRVNGVVCAESGTTYNVSVQSRRFHTSSFSQRIQPGTQQAPPVTLFTDHAKVKEIKAAGYSQLKNFHLRRVLEAANIPQMQFQGEALYQRLDNLQKACLLNVAAKASDPSSAEIWSEVTSVVRIEQDRCFVMLARDLLDYLESDLAETYKSVSSLLHDPMPGFHITGSFKTRDAQANLQITLMSDGTRFAADIDIDESAGAGHVFEVIRNTFGGPTEPYQVHELLVHNKITPEYELVC